MAMNPMQRRARNSFLVGFLVALIIMALVVILLLVKIKSLNQAKAELESEYITAYVAAEDLKSGQVITLDDDFMTQTVRTTVDSSEIISPDDFEFKDSNGDIITKYNDDGSIKVKEMVVKIDIPAGTIVTKDMIVESGEETTNSQRIQEFNMIILPTQLKNGDYIDIRWSLSTGQDFIVLSKKRVLGTNANSIWIKLDEAELLTINSAIVEAYKLPSSKLYATQYSEAGLQEASVATYVPPVEVVDLITTKDMNITEEARKGLADRYMNDASIRADYISPALFNYIEQSDSLVQNGFEQEIENIKASRQQFVEELEGSGEVGYER